MKTIFFTLCFLSLLLSSCFKYKTVSFHTETTESRIAFPTGVKTLELLNRTRPIKRGIIKYMTDGQGSSMANRPGVGNTLTSFRNKVVARKYFKSVSFPKVMNAEQSFDFPPALNLTDLIDLYGEKEYVVASLEVFQIEESQQYFNERKKQLNQDGSEYFINIVRGIKTLKATTGWRLYNGKTGEIIDEHKLNHKHEYEVEGVDRANTNVKMESLIEKAYQDLSGILGQMYAEDVSPLAHYVYRRYYTKSRSCPELKQAHDFIKMKDWETAKAIWEDGLKLNVKPKDVAKLHYNLAVFYEQANNINKAIEHITEAKKLNAKVVNGYDKTLSSIKTRGYSK